MIASIQHPTETSKTSGILNYLQNCLEKQLHQSALTWLNWTMEKLSENPSQQTLFIGFSQAARQVGKANLSLSQEALSTARQLRPGWMPEYWTVDQTVRTLLLLNFRAEDADDYLASIEKLFSAADVAEQIALYQSLPVLPYPEQLKARAIEGLRTNMVTVFNAIALHNPYPADYFDEAAWNQMVLKALFVESHLSQIQGLDSRVNAKLAKMLSDYAHERWSAGRSVNPQLWRGMGSFTEGEILADLDKVLREGEPFEQQAAALACYRGSAEAQALLDRVPTLKQAIEQGQLTWESFSQTHL
ncbi:EboA family metabolite traffic protein [Cyanothece sp. BG0011]|uniref:EboA family metabolite traffic protein n=1 Tax=Cyanothece sp. BG0011 TaxID=2082950 RepID=UPI000D1ECE69|nr:EboA family metabolite traffic protein [Cyanothece sp. BG0011]